MREGKKEGKLITVMALFIPNPNRLLLSSIPIECDEHGSCLSFLDAFFILLHYLEIDTAPQIKISYILTLNLFNYIM